MKYNKSIMILDTKRRIDDNYNMHIEDNILTQEGIAEYLGSEIKQWQELGLDPNQVYKVYRPRDVLERDKDTFNRLPVTFEHPDGMIERTKIPKEDIIGTAGEKAYVDANGNLLNSLTFWDNAAVEAIVKNEIKGLSCGYVWDVEVKPGVFNNENYDLIITGISGNHIALTENPRVKGSMIADSMKGGIMSKLNELQNAFKTIFNLTKDSENKKPTLDERLAVIDEALKKGDNETIKDMIRDMMKDESEEERRRREAVGMAEYAQKHGENTLYNRDKTQGDESEEERRRREAVGMAEYAQKHGENTLYNRDKTQGDDRPLTVGEFKELMEELKNNYKKEHEMEIDEENKASEIAKDCAKRLGYGNVVGTSTQITDQILKDKGITVDSKMSRDNKISMLLGLTQAMVINDSNKTNNIIIDSQKASDPQIEALLSM